MSHFLNFVTNANGVVIDRTMSQQLSSVLAPPFNFREVNIYSHGWWNDAASAMGTYNRFSIGYASLIRAAAMKSTSLRLPGASLNIGVHWPSMLSENDRSVLNLLEAATFFTMEKRADDVGETGVYAMLRAMLASCPGDERLRLNLLGHSFGCKVISAAAQRLAAECFAELSHADLNLVLLQPAFDDDDLEPNELYGKLSTVPTLRVLTTRSNEDSALSRAFPLAHRLEFFHPHASKTALGAAGPSAKTIAAFGQCESLSVEPGERFVDSPPLVARLVCADLSPLHRANPQNATESSGHHCDIYYAEIYGLIARFLY